MDILYIFLHGSKFEIVILCGTFCIIFGRLMFVVNVDERDSHLISRIWILKYFDMGTRVSPNRIRSAYRQYTNDSMVALNFLFVVTKGTQGYLRNSIVPGYGGRLTLSYYEENMPKMM